ncbi:MAG: B12-binding domain-containing radical SAM protein [Acidimicrobiales bacterium]|nr:B12-binding domain-containing radical SAM protein [Acidimicrobiales bacterium]
MDAQVVAGAGALVVRSADGWLSTPADGVEPVELAFTDVIGMLRAIGGEDRVATGWEGLEPVRGDAFVEPPDSFVGVVRGGWFGIEGFGTGRALLDVVDLCLFDVLTDATVAAPLYDRADESVRTHLGVEPPSREEWGARLRRLVVHGRVRMVDEPAPPAPVAEAPVPEPEPEPEAAPVPATLYRRARRVARPLKRLVRGRPATAPVGAEPAETDAPEAEAPAPAEPAAEPVVAAVEADPAPVGGDPFASSGGSGAPVRYLDAPTVGPERAGRTPVYAVWQVEIGPLLSLGMLTAAARAHDGGSLEEHFEIRRPEDPASFLEDLRGRSGPAVLLLSNYVWSIDHNLALAAEAKAINPDLVIVHGGPSTPKYADDCVRYFGEHAPLVDVTVRGEGEVTLPAILEALAPSLPEIDLALMAGVEGLSYRDPATGEVVHNGDRERLTDLNVLPSPYLTGEFDHISPEAWVCVIHETNRGCPYGCTFCDWGSSTLSRIRKFDIDRLTAEMEWAAERGIQAWAVADANFGIMSRDVEVASRIVEIRERTGAPSFFGFNVAKNTTKHLTDLVDRLVSANVTPYFTLALQTRDDETLDAIRRSNISSDHYVSLAASFRRRQLPLSADLMIGLPGQTVSSFSADLQFLMDHDVPARMWIAQLLPNAPINDPEYRAEHQVVADEHSMIMSTKSFTFEDRREMLRIRHAYTVFERYGLLRHVARFVQWDHGVPAMDLFLRIVEVSREDPERYPLLNWIVRYFDWFNVAPVGWGSYAAEVRRFVNQEFDVPLTPALDTVLAVQVSLLPDTGRPFPLEVDLDHDYVTYFRDNTYSLWTDGHNRPTGRPLGEYGPATFTVVGDPAGRCKEGMRRPPDSRNERMMEEFWLSGHWELDSPLAQNHSEVAAAGTYTSLKDQVPTDLPPEPEPASRVTENIRIRVAERAAVG